MAQDADSVVDPPDMAQDMSGGSTTECVIGSEGGFCVAGRCALVVPPGAVSEPTAFEFEEAFAPSAIEAAILGGTVCAIGPQELALDAAVEVRIEFAEEELPATFELSDVVGARVDTADLEFVTTSVLDTARQRVSVFVEQSGEYGLTVSPSDARFEGDFGRPSFDVTDDESFVRNLSTFTFNAVFHDGERLYVGNGPRVLVWEGMPESAFDLPDLIIGRPDLSTINAPTSAAALTGSVRGIWSDAQRLAITDGNRVLIWNEMPTKSFTPADLVLGQESFSANRPTKDSGQARRSTLSRATGITSNGQNLIVGDMRNNRFLVWDDFPRLSDLPADRVIGQPDFSSTRPSAGNTPISQAQHALFMGNELILSEFSACSCLWVLDGTSFSLNPTPARAIGLPGPSRVTPTGFIGASGLTRFGADGLAMMNATTSRISVWRELPTDAGRPADFTLGKPNDEVGGLLEHPSAAYMDSLGVDRNIFANETFLTATDRYRLLIWNTLPQTNFEPADLVLGQPTTTSSDRSIDFRGISADTTGQPSGLAQSGTTRAIADRANNRVLLFLEGSDQPIVLGQADMDEFKPNAGASEPSASSLSAPESVVIHGSTLVVADTGNHRVLVWDELPSEHGAPANHVLGQASFMQRLPNAGALDTDEDGDRDASAGVFHTPSGVFLDDRGLLVADTDNHRVLEYALPLSSESLPSRVIGQPNFERNDPNAGKGWYERDASTLARPKRAIRMDAGEVVVSDTDNNRVLVFGPNPGAITILGQNDGTSDREPSIFTGSNRGFGIGQSQLRADAASLRRPHGLALGRNHLYVADRDNHRVVRYDLPLSTGASASAIWGQLGPTERGINGPGLSARSLAFPEGVSVTGEDDQETLIVADTENHRVLDFPKGDMTATSIFGQASFSARGINRSAPARGVVDRPAGISYDGESLWVADREHHRVLEFFGGEVVRVIGQPDEGATVPNAGQDVSAFGFDTPSDVFTDGERLIVADRFNHRVLIWNQIPESFGQPADVVLGQEDETGNQPNRGLGLLEPTAGTLLAPEGVFFDGAALYVADTGNNRVLVWDELPMVSGAPASRVLCQQEMTQNLSNRGSSSPGATTCSSPRDILRVDDALYVTDSANNRVLAFGAQALSDGAEAQSVLGQAAFTTRVSAAGASGMAAPSRLAHDGRSLFVSDTGNNRVLLFRSTESVSAADQVIGQPSFDVVDTSSDERTLSAPNGLAVERLPFSTTRLLVSDSGKDRIATFGRISRSR